MIWNVVAVIAGNSHEFLTCADEFCFTLGGTSLAFKFASEGWFVTHDTKWIDIRHPEELAALKDFGVLFYGTYKQRKDLKAIYCALSVAYQAGSLTL